jgi:heme exporter protein A
VSVARRFGQRWALRGISLRVEYGEAVALIGANGSGKSTLLRIAATALRPTRGTAFVCGHDVVKEADAVRSLVGMLGHAPGVYEDLTAAENLRFTLQMLGRPAHREAIAESLALAGLAADERERVRGFSAGMQRRLALARLLIQAPRLLLLDEPYSAFDAGGIALVNALIDRTRTQGGAVVLVTHDLARARSVADRWVRLEGGHLAPVEPGLALTDVMTSSDEAALSEPWTADRGGSR